MIHAKLTSKGQITLPAPLRAKLHLAAGDRVYFEEMPDGNWVMRTKTRDIRELKGIVKAPPGKVVTLEDMDRAIAEGAVERYLRSAS